ncbi:PQQ-binding-like beta-propeller repeat protein [Nucisporomicrobium flavum]|uniref:outer membrane protein assembly factor BamB family protein n=1 Tax=Nucisporomicrobium flavum TaxID=2785915 RepID=UPI0018F541C3|nr:PQQ-binding-like beta-propeller repeat protein [Nucisporomicrobium flavum]
MPDAVPLIDLDLAPPHAPAEPAPLRRLPVPGRIPRILGVLAAVLLTMTAAVPPAPALDRVLSAGGTAAAAFTLGPDALFTATFGQNPDSEAGIRRYDLPGGTQAWATAVPQNVQSLSLEPQSGVLLARSGSDPRMVFLDAADGTVLWRLAEAGTSAVRLTGGRVLLRKDVPPDRMELKLADARTGTPLWTRMLAGYSELRDDTVGAGPPRRLYVIGYDGHVTTLNLADGRVLGSGDLGVRLRAEYNSDTDLDYTSVDVSGDELYLSRREGGRVSLAAYRLPALSPKWQVRGGALGTVYACGRILCMSDGHRLNGIDPDDGSLLWTAPAWSSAGLTPDGRLVAATWAEDPETAEIDPASGAVLRPLAHTFFVGDVELRGDTKLTGRTWVSITGGDGAPHTVGWLDTTAPYGCEADGPYLACPTIAGPTGVWRLPLT